MQKSEKQIEKYLVEKVKKLGGRAYKFVSPGNNGVPDRIVMLPGKIIFVELKAEGKRNNLSLNQKIQIKRITDLGGKVFVASTYEEVDEIFRGD